jgi:hypothetical protein
VVFADDFVESPGNWANQYRFLAAAQLYVGNLLLGSEFLLTRVPKLVAGISLVGAAIFFQRFLAEIGVRRLISAVVFLVVLWHPALNDVVLWNDVAMLYGLPILLLAVGLAFAVATTNTRVSVIVSIIIAVGMSSYQLLVGVGVTFAGLGWLLCQNRAKGRAVLLATIGGVLLYGSSVIFTPLLLGWSPAAVGRNVVVGLEDYLSTGFWEAKLHGMMDILAVLSQPILSNLFGWRAAGRLWYIVMVAVWLTGGVGLWLLSARRSLVIAFAPSLFTLIPLAPLLMTPFSAVGFRTATAALLGTIPALVGMCVALSLVIGRITGSAQTWIASLMIGAVLLPPLARVTVLDTGFRIEAQRTDRKLLEEVGGYWRDAGVAPEKVRLLMCEGSQENKPPPDGLLSGFQPLGSFSYSNLVWFAWPAFVGRSGFRGEAMIPKGPDCWFQVPAMAREQKISSWPYVRVFNDRAEHVTYVLWSPPTS